MAGPLAQALIAHFDSVFHGPNGDYPALLEALAGLAVAQAAWKPTPEHNSVWQIVDHLTASKLWQIDILEVGEATPPPWTQPTGDERDWQAAVARLKDAHTRLRETLERVPEGDLLTVAEPECNRTLLELLLSSAAHEAHHCGQVDYLKGLQAGTAER